MGLFEISHEVFHCHQRILGRRATGPCFGSVAPVAQLNIAWRRGEEVIQNSSPFVVSEEVDSPCDQSYLYSWKPLAGLKPSWRSIVLVVLLVSSSLLALSSLCIDRFTGYQPHFCYREGGFMSIS